jgi:2-haloacid dehalogenase
VDNLEITMNEIRALTFDTGGTILDWHGGIRAALEAAGKRRGVEADWVALTNEYRRRSLQTMVNTVGTRFNIDDVHRSVLEAILRERKLDALNAEDRDAVWQTWHALKCWPDFPAALERLRKKYLVISYTILSTALAIDVSRLNGIRWDAILSCEMWGVYKTRPEAYQTAAKLLQIPPQNLLMVACHNFDLDAAKKEGFNTAFVRRPDEWGPPGPPDPKPNPIHDIVVDDFGALADRLGC